MGLTYLFIGIGVVLVFWIISNYNFFVTAKARIKASVQEIGNQLKRQMDLIPNLENSVKGYLKQEKEIFKDLTDARKAVEKAVESKDIKKMADAGSEVASILPKLQVIVESNPEIKSAGVVSKLMDELRDTSDKVMYARRIVIDLTADYNVRRATFPSNIVAMLFKFDELPGLLTPQEGEHVEVKEGELKSPKISL